MLFNNFFRIKVFKIKCIKVKKQYYNKNYGRKNKFKSKKISSKRKEVNISITLQQKIVMNVVENLREIKVLNHFTDIV